MAKRSQASGKKPKASESGRDAILDAAEQLFAERGLDAVSLRTINTEAGYSVAALHYHFGTRDGLIKALLARTQPPMLERRARMIQILRESGDPPSVHGIAAALVMPLAASVLDDPMRGSRRLRFLARLYFDRSTWMSSTLDDSLEVFVPLLRRALPHVDPQTLVTRWIMAAELTLGFVSRLPTFESGLTKAKRSELEAALGELVNFIVGGLENGRPEDSAATAAPSRSSSGRSSSTAAG